MIYYLIVINVISFIVYGFDKFQAVNKRFRIPESTLIALALIGGTAGSILAMIIFRHKMRKPLFLTLIPVIAIFQIYLFTQYMK